MLDGSEWEAAQPGARRLSLLAQPAVVRVLVAALCLVPLWLAVAWAVAVP